MITDAKILIVEDYKPNRLTLVTYLKRLGISNILQAENGREALDILSDKPVDLVLLDIMMPVVDGYEVLKHMKSNKNLRQIPVIMITAVDDMDSAIKCIELGAEDYL
ncbi:MAG: response regulator, partial [Desulfobacterales bacterium]